ncbi:hypothetical protein ACFQXA_36820 [Nocardiopsis composta]
MLTVAEAGVHRLSVRVRGGYATLTLDGEVALEAGEVFGPQSSLTLDLAEGEYRLGLSGWAWQASPLEVELAWVTPSMAREDIAEAAAAAGRRAPRWCSRTTTGPRATTGPRCRCRATRTP